MYERKHGEEKRLEFQFDRQVGCWVALRVVSQAGPITVRTGVFSQGLRRLLERPVAMTFRKAGFIDWREAEAEGGEFSGE